MKLQKPKTSKFFWKQTKDHSSILLSTTMTLSNKFLTGWWNRGKLVWLCGVYHFRTTSVTRFWSTTTELLVKRSEVLCRFKPYSVRSGSWTWRNLSQYSRLEIIHEALLPVNHFKKTIYHRHHRLNSHYFRLFKLRAFTRKLFNIDHTFTASIRLNHLVSDVQEMARHT